MLAVQIPPVSEQERRGVGPVLQEAARRQPNVRVVWADGPLAVGAAPRGCQLVIVAKLVGQKTFAVLPCRWVVERTFA